MNILNFFLNIRFFTIISQLPTIISFINVCRDVYEKTMARPRPVPTVDDVDSILESFQKLLESGVINIQAEQAKNIDLCVENLQTALRMIVKPHDEATAHIQQKIAGN